ncbi:hypothetical protein [Halonotius sp. GCM10025705]|uniref:hypothetical protein n=1 Tax=Halonotius sp. GCM10025705 TaxID=3252678 RepID=UPI00361C2705
MNKIIRSRLLLLVGLSILGIGIAAVGTTFMMPEQLATTGTNSEFIVSDENVTFTTGNESEILVHNTSNLSQISIRETETGHFSISTTENQVLNASERERAREVALDNSTVAQGLDKIDEYEVSVEPIQQVTLSDTTSQSYNISINNSSEMSGDTFTINETSVERHQSDSVTISRDSNYVADSAVVRIREQRQGGSGELIYVIDVDLSTDRVTEVVDWRSI